MLVTQLCPALCDPMDYSLPGKNTGVGCHSLLQEIFPAQQSNTGLPHCRQILCHLSHQCHRDSLILRVGSLADEAHSISSVQFSSVVQSCLTLWDPVNHSTPGLPVHHQLPEFTQTHVHWVGDAIQPSRPLSSPSPLAPNPSQHQGLFQWVNSLHEVAKYWSFSFNISPSNEYPGLISFRMDWLDLLAVQGTLKRLLQHHSSKASILRRSAFFTVQLSHLYVTTYSS